MKWCRHHLSQARASGPSTLLRHFARQVCTLLHKNILLRTLRFELRCIFHVDGLAPDASNGLFPNQYYEIAGAYVDDLISATHHAARLAEDFLRRFGAKISPPGSMYVGMDYLQNLAEGWVSIGFETCLNRAMERMKNLDPDEINLRSIVGILLWVSLHIFATYLAEVKALTRRTNQNLPEDGKTAMGLLYELYARRGQKIYYRRNDETTPRFQPRSSRIGGIDDVSNFYESIPESNGEVIVTPEDILNADDGIDVYVPDQDDRSPDDEELAVDENFVIETATDASYAAEESSRRSMLGGIVFVNGGPVDWFAILMKGIAESSFSSEYCSMSMGTKSTLLIWPIMNFMGIQPPCPIQYCDSTSAKQVALNPRTLGAARSLGIRMHSTRYAIAKSNLKLKYSITEDMVADFLTKRMPRKKLARLSIIFFNNLKSNWKEDPDHLKPLRDAEWYLDL